MLSYVHSLWKQRRNIAQLIWNDFSQHYLASYLGFLWAIINPLIMLIVLTIVFQVGFRVQHIEGNTPFTAWLLCGMIPWLYFAEGLTAGAQSVTAYSFLVRKAVFRISYLPAIRLCASSIIHWILLVFLLVILLYFNFFPTYFWLQLIFYFSCMYVFLLGTAWFSSSIAVFVPDIVNFLSVCTNLGFWITPIFWNKSMMPEKWQWVFTVNPAYYIVQGYRDTFLEGRWIWERPYTEHISFGIWVTVMLVLGGITFKRLRPHFADVL